MRRTGDMSGGIAGLNVDGGGDGARKRDDLDRGCASWLVARVSCLVSRVATPCRPRPTCRHVQRPREEVHTYLTLPQIKYLS